MHLIPFLIGFFIGGCFGLMAGAILAGAQWADECSKCLSRKAGK